LSAVAIGALDDTESAGVSQHLLTCRDCRQEFDRLSGVVDLFGFAVPQVEPPAALRDSILGNLEPSSTVTRFARWRWVASIAAALIIVLLAGNIALQLRGTSAAPPVATPSLTAARTTVPLEWYNLTAASPDAGKGWGILCAQQTGTLAWLVVQDLPQLKTNMIYQAWLWDGDQRVNAGTFTVDAQGRGFLTIRLSSSETLSHFTSLGVTEEPSGGSTAPSGTRYLAASL
jgi:hypothetical protein